MDEQLMRRLGILAGPGRLQVKTAAAAPVEVRSGDRMSKDRSSLAVPFQIKADALDESARTFTGLASTYDLDLGGDVILPGAFKKTLKDWQKSKKALPLMDSHGWSGGTLSVIGKMLEAEEGTDGLTAKFALLPPGDPTADGVWMRMKEGIVTGLSIGYRPVRITVPTEDDMAKGVWRYLDEVKLEEVSVVVWPMNPGARVDGASFGKMLEQFKGRRLNDVERAELKAMVEQANAVLTAADTSSETVTPPAPEPVVKQLDPADPLRGDLERRARVLTLRTLPLPRLSA